uniref:Uncharacterized protein n=1 Tax=Naja naja TaxID=35670 RepID=A0A8C6X6F8_NAJNA
RESPKLISLVRFFTDYPTRVQSQLQKQDVYKKRQVDSLPKLKDLAFLKDQLESLKQKVENEVQAGVGQDGSWLASPFVKGFLAGFVVAKLRSSAVIGFLVGSCTGVFAAQTYAIPDVEKTVKDYFNSSRKRSN